MIIIFYFSSKKFICIAICLQMIIVFHIRWIQVFIHSFIFIFQSDRFPLTVDVVLWWSAFRVSCVLAWSSYSRRNGQSFFRSNVSIGSGYYSFIDCQRVKDIYPFILDRSPSTIDDVLWWSAHRVSYVHIRSSCSNADVITRCAFTSDVIECEHMFWSTFTLAIFLNWCNLLHWTNYLIIM